MGIQIDLLKMPVCNSFRPKIFYSQLCYEVDVNPFIERKYQISSEIGLSFLVDTNFNRQYSLKEQSTKATFANTMGNVNN